MDELGELTEEDRARLEVLKIKMGLNLDPSEGPQCDVCGVHARQFRPPPGHHCGIRKMFQDNLIREFPTVDGTKMLCEGCERKELIKLLQFLIDNSGGLRENV